MMTRVLRGTNVTTFQPGETITVTWTETVDHPGHYRIAFDDDGTDGLLDPRQPTDNYSFTLVDRIADDMVKAPSEVALSALESLKATSYKVQFLLYFL